MSELVIFGGRPVTKNIIGKKRLVNREDLEKKYLIELVRNDNYDYMDPESMISRFEREWAKFNNSKYSVLITNGTQSIQLALEASNIGYGDEVIVPGLTWHATASAVCDVNAIPIMVDVEENTLCIDPFKIEKEITTKTKAIIPVHLYHRMANMDSITKIAKKYKLYVIEDCAHAHGSTWNNRGAGTLGDFGSYSFQSSKLLNCNEGGALLIQDRDLYQTIISLRNCGRENFKGYKMHSGNYRITNYQAAILLGRLEAFRKNVDIFERNGRALDKAVADSPGVEPLFRNENINRQCSYMFTFLYKKEHYDGLDLELFRKALSLEIGIEILPTYTPLSHSEVYYPHTKKRHDINEKYINNINPSKWRLPIIENLWENEAVVIPWWSILACPPERAGILTDSIVKIYKNREKLKSKYNK